MDETRGQTITRDKLDEIAKNLVERFNDECGYTLTYLQKVGILTVLTEKGDLEDIFNDVGVRVE